MWVLVSFWTTWTKTMKNKEKKTTMLLNHDPLSQWAQWFLSLELRSKVTSIPQAVKTCPLDSSSDMLPEPGAILSILSLSADRCGENPG